MKSLKEVILILFAQILWLVPMTLLQGWSPISDLSPRHYQSVDAQMRDCLNVGQASVKDWAERQKGHMSAEEVDKAVLLQRESARALCAQTSQTALSVKDKGFLSVFVGSNPWEYLINASGLFLVFFLIYAAVKHPVKKTVLNKFFALGMIQMVATTLTARAMSPALCILAVITCLAAAKRNEQIGNAKTIALLLAGVFSSILHNVAFLVAELILGDKGLLDLPHYEINAFARHYQFGTLSALYCISLIYFFYTVQCLINLRQNSLAKMMAFFTAIFMNFTYLTVFIAVITRGGNGHVPRILFAIALFMHPMLFPTLVLLFLSLHYTRTKFEQVNALASLDKQ